MYKFIKTYPNVRQFAVGNNQLYGIKDKQLFDLKTETLIGEFENTLQFLQSGLKYFRFHENNGNGYLLRNSSYEFYEKQFFYTEISENEFICLNNKETHLFNTETKNKNKILDFNISLYFYLDSFLYLRNKTFIQKQNIHSTEPAWQFDLSTLERYKNWGEDKVQEIGYFIGVYGDILWVSLLSNQLLGLDILNGEVKFHLKGVEKSSSFGDIDDSGDIVDGKYCIWNNRFVIDNETGIMRGSYNERYYEMNLNVENPQMELYGLKDQFKEFGIENIFRFGRLPVLVGDEYFMMNHKDKKIVILDTLTKKIKYVTDPIAIKGTERAQLQEFQVHENKIYVVDNMCYLYEYERI